MDLTIHGRHVEVSEREREHIEKKIGRLDRYLPTLTEARVDVSEEQTRQEAHRYTVQVTLYDTRGTILRGEERSGDVLAAVDTVLDKLHRQILRYKGKRQDRYQRAVPETWGEESPIDWEDEEEEGEVVRTKRFSVSPMDVNEAIEQMELLGHSFFVYYDADRGNVNVLYRRHDGNYGLIIPELA